jgi:hypothetical protein
MEDKKRSRREKTKNTPNFLLLFVSPIIWEKDAKKEAEKRL